MVEADRRRALVGTPHAGGATRREWDLHSRRVTISTTSPDWEVPGVFSPSLIALVALGYVGLLFALAWFGDRLPEGRLDGRCRAIVYSLSLAVYCTSWTFFGAVGSAASDGWLFATIYIGPILVLVFGHDLMHRILKLSREQRLTSIADFIAHRFGKSRPLAVLVTLAAVLGSIPYIALQLKAVTNGVVVLADDSTTLSESSLALVLALALGVFAILFGARRLEASEHHRGMVMLAGLQPSGAEQDREYAQRKRKHQRQR